MVRPNDQRKETEDRGKIDASQLGDGMAGDLGGGKTGRDMLGGNEIDQSRRGASVDEGMLSKGERRRGGQDVKDDV